MERHTEDRARTRGMAAVVVGALVVLVATAGVVAGAGGTTVSIQPATESVDVGETATFRVVVNDVDGGVGAAEIGIAVENPETATITSVNALGTGQQQVDIAADGSSAEVEYAFQDTADSGTVPIVEVVVEGRTDGVTGLSLGPAKDNGDIRVYDESGTGYEMTGTTGVTLTVGAAATPEPATTTPSGSTSESTEQPTVATEAADDADAPDSAVEASVADSTTIDPADRLQNAFSTPLLVALAVVVALVVGIFVGRRN